jgi:hypothetical protein
MEKKTNAMGRNCRISPPEPTRPKPSFSLKPNRYTKGTGFASKPLGDCFFLSLPAGSKDGAGNLLSRLPLKRMKPPALKKEAE